MQSPPYGPKRRLLKRRAIVGPEEFICLDPRPAHLKEEPSWTVLWGTCSELGAGLDVLRGGFVTSVLTVHQSTGRLSENFSLYHYLIPKSFAKVRQMRMEDWLWREESVLWSSSWTTCTLDDPDAVQRNWGWGGHSVRSSGLAWRGWNFLMKAWIEVSPIDAEGMGRTAAKVESIEETLKKLEVAAATHVSQQCNYFRGGDRRGVDCLGERSRGVKIGWMPDEAGFTTFKKVEADRLTFVGTPSFDPTPYLDERSQAIFNDPIQCRDDPASYRGPVPKLKVHCPPDEKLKLYELLDASNRLGVHRKSEVSLKFGSGLFAVTKDLSRDRLILDSRGANLIRETCSKMDPFASLWGVPGQVGPKEGRGVESQRQRP